MENCRCNSDSHDPLQAALHLLREANLHGSETGLDFWQFATSLSALRTTGISDSAIRWLVHSGYVEHAVERTRSGDPSRVFHQTNNLALFRRSCFVLTPRGRGIFGDAPTACCIACRAGLHQREHENGSSPLWDQALHTLFWNGRVLKQFKSEAPNQEALLREFEAARWRRCVSAKITDDIGLRAKERLHEAIKSLNRNVSRYLRFTQEGNGTRVCWQPASRTPNAPPMHPQHTP